MQRHPEADGATLRIGWKVGGRACNVARLGPFTFETMEKGALMADQSKLTIRVDSATNTTTLNLTSAGRYKGLTTNTVKVQLLRQPVFTSATELTYWHAVLNAALAEIIALGG